ncbi:hypothetical protein R2B67_00130 [Streptomyces cyaneofuscatus]|uniref:hypothetical protein n=1 Tax=Streptomyces cyaneofuscatus TaxID=66883 RepID=UPI0029549034|nr:hypothetical protein [Streptomyces cyaneofuscatus]WOP07038.1 hypothetical protein R2B67_00130 [Streptomyces cyaneofuscatus]
MNAEQLINSMRPEVERLVSDLEMAPRMRAGEVNREQLQRLLIGEFYCQEAELTTYGLLITRHRHEIPAGFFGLTLHTVAKARRMLWPAAQSVGLEPASMTVPAAGRLGQAMSMPAMLTEPGEAALYLHSDLSVWCAVFAELAELARDSDVVPKELIDYLASWGSEPPPEIADGACEVLQYALSQGEDPERIIDFSRHQLASSVPVYWDYVLLG